MPDCDVKLGLLWVWAGLTRSKLNQRWMFGKNESPKAIRQTGWCCPSLVILWKEV